MNSSNVSKEWNEETRQIMDKLVADLKEQQEKGGVITMDLTLRFLPSGKDMVYLLSYRDKDEKSVFLTNIGDL